MTSETRFSKAIEAIDNANRKDPNVELSDGKSTPGEYLYSLRMTRLLNEFEPNASEALRLAARCQHIERWVIPRETYPMTRIGYIKWRNELKRYHADRADQILREAGYSEEITERVSDLVLKKGIRTDPEVQILEDVICLVFLKYYFESFSKKHESDKIIDILSKTWKKMSEKGQKEALKLDLSPSAQKLVQEALS